MVEIISENVTSSSVLLKKPLSLILPKLGRNSLISTEYTMLAVLICLPKIML